MSLKRSRLSPIQASTRKSRVSEIPSSLREPTHEESLKSFTEKRSSRKISHFMRTHRPKIQARFLNSICSDSNVCIAFGIESDKIKAFFDNFSFDYLVLSALKKISDSSGNGKIILLTFEKEGYFANAVLKLSKRINADNLFYEGVVGNFINKKRLQFPCFVETYGLFTNSHRSANIKDYTRVNINQASLIESCVDPLSILLMVENIQGARTLQSMLIAPDMRSLNMHEQDFINFMDNEMLGILYQIYAPLSILCDEFTHYDLHLNNILLYEPVTGGYITYHYHYDHYTVTFHSKYIVKLIDYGRSFFHDATGYNPTDIHRDLCNSQTPDCIHCGFEKGFGWLHPRSNELLQKSSYIYPQVRNISHDLRPLLYLKHNLPTIYRKDLYHIIHSVVYFQPSGTPENIALNIPYTPVKNVNNARYRLEKVIKPTAYPGTKLGDMHIYSDGRPMVYEPV